MEIRTQKFVTLSDLFAGLDTLDDLFKESDHSEIWGGANRTMITLNYFHEWERCERDIIMEEGATGEYEVLAGRIKELPDGVMVDLEN